MVLLFSSITDCHICCNNWTFKFASILPQILEGYDIVAHFLLQTCWHLNEPFFCWGFCWVLQFPCVVPLRWEQVISCCAASSLSSCSSLSCYIAFPAGFCTASAWPASTGPAPVSCLRQPQWERLQVLPLYPGAWLTSIEIIHTAYSQSNSQHCATLLLLLYELIKRINTSYH